MEEYQVDTLVLGFPKNMNNTIGDRAEKSLEFQGMLERRTGLPVVMWDERLTTVEAVSYTHLRAHETSAVMLWWKRKKSWRLCREFLNR